MSALFAYLRLSFVIAKSSNPAAQGAATTVCRSDRGLPIFLALFSLLALSAPSTFAQIYQWTNFVGSPGYGTTDGTGSDARFNFPVGAAVDTSGIIYVADTGNHTIRKVTPDGVVSTLAGLVGSSGSSDGTGSAARFNQPAGVAVDSSGNVYVADSMNRVIRKVTSDGVVSTLAGLPGVSGSSDGMGTAARFSAPSSITVDTSGNLYVADSESHTIRKVTPVGLVTTLAGLAGSSGSTDATGAAARFNGPKGIAVDSSGNVYVADSNNNTIRKVTSIGAVSTLAGLAGSGDSTNGVGSNARFNRPSGVAVGGSGNLYVADSSNLMIRKVTPAGVVSTLAGGSLGSNDGTGSDACFFSPAGVAVDSNGSLYVTDSMNNTLRKVTSLGVVSTLAGLAAKGVTYGTNDGMVLAARFNSPMGVAVDSSGNTYIADTSNCTIRKITPTGVVTTLAGLANTPGSTDGTGSAARFNLPSGVAVDTSGNVYVADTYNHTIRKVTPAGVVTTLAGLAGTSGSADGTVATARFNIPYDVEVDSSGNVYVADNVNRTIRKVTPGGSVSTLAGLAGSSGSVDGTGSAARFNSPSGLAVDTSGNVYVADFGSHTIRKVTSGGAVSTLAGLAGVIGSSDGTGSVARFYYPNSVTVGSSGNIYVADTHNNTIRKVTPAGVVTTLAGLAGNIGSTDGTGSAASFYYPYGVAVDASSNIYVADFKNNTIRKVTSSGAVSTLAGLTGGSQGGSDGTGSAARFYFPTRMTIDDSGNVYVADTNNHTIRKVTPDGVVTTLAGLLSNSGSSDGTGSAARFDSPAGVAVDVNNGNVYVSDTNNHTIRKITPAGAVTTLAGLAGSSGSTDGTRNAARFNNPRSIAVDGSGYIYVAETGNIRKVTPSGVVTTLTALAGYSTSVATDSIGNVYAASAGVICKMTPAGEVTTLAGGSVGSNDGTGTAAKFSSPRLAVDGSGNVFVADTGNKTIRKVTPAGVVSTIGGRVGVVGWFDGIAGTSLFSSPYGIAVSSSGTIYVADADNNRISMGKVVYDITVRQPDGTSISPGGSQNWTLLPGGTTSLTFTISNPGTQDLTGLTITKDGADAADFTVTASPADTVSPGGNTTFTVQFAPTASSTQTLVKTASLHIASNTAGMSPFDINLTGTVLSNTQSTGNDGMSDAAKFQLSSLGFNWQLSQPALVNAYYSNANAANLYTQTQYNANRTAGQNDVTSAPNTYSLYTLSQIQTLNASTPLLTKNPSTGQFKLTIGIQQTPSLSQPFTAFPLSAPDTSINAQGQLEFLFTVPGNAAFFRVQAK